MLTFNMPITKDQIPIVQIHLSKNPWTLWGTMYIKTYIYIYSHYCNIYGNRERDTVQKGPILHSGEHCEQRRKVHYHDQERECGVGKRGCMERSRRDTLHPIRPGDAQLHQGSRSWIPERIRGVERVQERYCVKLSKQACKDMDELVHDGYGKKIEDILTLMEKDPFYSPPPCEKLTLNLEGYYSRRINIQHRIVFKIVPSEEFKGEVLIMRMKGHYKGIHSLLMLWYKVQTSWFQQWVNSMFKIYTTLTGPLR